MSPSFLDSAAIPWLPLDPALPGVLVKYLSIDTIARETVSLLQMPVGVALPVHRHVGPVSVYTLEGRWRYLEHEWIAGPGSFVAEPAGSTHTPQTLDSASGVVVTLNYVRGDLEMLNAAGEVIGVENCATALRRRRQAERAER
jgi:2,4'-dihydroxyacetophenone dioxygenase